VELDKPTASGAPLEMADKFDLEAIIEDAELLEILLAALAALTSDERLLLRGTYVDGQTERELAHLLGLVQGASVNKRKQRILEKLHNFMASKGFHSKMADQEQMELRLMYSEDEKLIKG